MCGIAAFPRLCTDVMKRTKHFLKIPKELGRGLLSACAAFMLLNLASVHAQAASSEWAETKGGRMRVVALPPDESGKIDAVLEIQPEPGWHTYWRAPGSGGIPPQVSVEPGGNVELEGIAFPPPEMISYDNNLHDYGYETAVALPLKLKQVVTGVPVTMKLSAFVGVCAEICIPFQADFTLKLSDSEEPDSGETALINAARAMLPEAPSEDFAIMDPSVAADGKSATIKLRLPQGVSSDNVSVFAYVGAQAFRPATVTETASGQFEARLEPYFIGAEETLHGKTIGVLVNTGLRAMESEFTRP